VNGDEAQRFDAVALIQEFEIRSDASCDAGATCNSPRDADGLEGAERRKLERVVAALS